MQKIVISTCFGGFGLSEAAILRYAEIKGSPFANNWDVSRDDPALVQVVEELGDKANSAYADLTVVEIPDGVEWEVDEYDGFEHVAEKHRRWP